MPLVPLWWTERLSDAGGKEIQRVGEPVSAELALKRAAVVAAIMDIPALSLRLIEGHMLVLTVAIGMGL